MNVAKVVQEIEQAKPEELRELFSTLSRLFAQKAETLYDKDPETNGVKAQPYADLSDFCDDASMVFEVEGGSVDVQSESLQAEPLTVTEAVTAAARRPTGNPWGSW